MSYAEVQERIGPADKDVGSGIHVMRYALDDGSWIQIGFPSFEKLIYVKHRLKSGEVLDLAK